MNEIKTQAIVLSSTDYRDADKKLALFSCEYGLVYATIKGVKKPKAKLSSFAQPFCFAEFLLSKKGDFFTVVNASSIESFFGLTSNFDKYVVGTAILEFCKKVVKMNDPSLELFVLTLKALKQLEMSKANEMLVLIKFLIDGLAIIGYSVKLDRCAVCGKDVMQVGGGYSYDLGGIVCGGCDKNLNLFELSRKEQKVLTTISKTAIDHLQGICEFERDELVASIKLFARQFRIYTGEELRSVEEYL